MGKMYIEERVFSTVLDTEILFYIWTIQNICYELILSFQDLSTEELKKMMMELQTKSCELDKLSTKILKMLIDELLTLIKTWRACLLVNEFSPQSGKMQQ